jgi:hypothetical protein
MSSFRMFQSEPNLSVHKNFLREIQLQAPFILTYFIIRVFVYFIITILISNFLVFQA